MGKISMIVAFLVGLSACHAHGGFGIGDNGQPPTDVASSALGSGIAQASIGTGAAAGD